MSQDLIEIPLPKVWPKHVRSAVAHDIALGRNARLAARGKAAPSPLATAPWRAKLNSARTEVSLLREELRIKDARMARIDPRKRPHYKPSERTAIIELRAARGWSQAQTARGFLVEPANEKPRIEPRPRWPRRSPCALPAAGQRTKSVRVVDLEVRYHGGDKRLPIVELRRAS